METNKTLNIELTNNIKELTKLHNKVSEFLSNVSDAIVNDVNLSLEEVIVNTISYGYKDDDKHTIEITLEIRDKLLSIQIIDDAHSFNPLKDTQAPDIDKPLDQRMVGGLGVFLVKTLMDDLSYKRENNQNILTLEKRL